MVSTLDPTVLVTPSPALLEYLQQQKLCDPPESVAALLAGKTEQQLGVAELRYLRSALPRLPASLLLGCSVELPRPRPAPRSPELEQRCAKLRAEQAEREYRAMTSNVVREGERNKEQERGVKQQLREVNTFLLLIVQFVVSVVCSFMFGFLGPYYLYGKTDLGGRLLFGIICGFVVGCADMYFVIRQLLEEDGIKLKKIE